MSPTVRIRSTTRADGDFAAPAPGAEPGADLLARRSAVAPGPWTWLRQVHGPEVVVVTRAGEHAGAEADAAVTSVPGAVLSVTTADCAPVVLVADGAVGVAHAGWKGLEAGVLAATVDALADLGGRVERAWIGPCIGPECYEFGPEDLDRLVAALGPEAAGRTAWGTPALDLPAAVRAALSDLGVATVDGPDSCTSCRPDLASHRARAETARQATVAWIEP